MAERLNDDDVGLTLTHENQRFQEEEAAFTPDVMQQLAEVSSIGNAEQPAPPGEQDDVASDGTSTERSILGDIVISAADGVRDGVQAMLDGADELGRWANEIVGLDELAPMGASVKIPLMATQMLQGSEATGELPEVSEGNPETVPGALAKGITQFLTGFMGPGRALKGAASLVKGGTAAQIGEGMARGAIADFSAFDGHDQRLSNLLQDADKLGVDLRNPVTEYLASDPNDGEAEGRFKAALEGTLVGGAATAVIHPMIAAVKAIKGARIAKAAVDADPDVVKFDDAGRASVVDDDGVARPVNNAETERVARQQHVINLEREIEGLAVKIQSSADEALQASQQAASVEKAIKVSQQNLGRSKKPETVAKWEARVTELKTQLEDVKATQSGLQENMQNYRLQQDAYKRQMAGTLDNDLNLDVRASAGNAWIKMTPEDMDTWVKALNSGDIEKAGEILGRDFNFGHMKSEADALTSINQISELVEKGIITVKGGDAAGVQSIASMKQGAARLVGTDPETIDQSLRRLFDEAGQKDLSGKVLASRIYLQSLHTKLASMARDLHMRDQAGMVSEREWAAFFDSVEFTANVQAMFKGVQTNMARAMRSMQVDVGPSDKIIKDLDISTMREAMQTRGGQKKLKSLAAKIATSPPDAQAGIIQKSFGRRLADVGVEWWLNSILSGPLTQSVNLSSNIATTVYLPLENSVAAAARLNWNNPARGVTMREVAAQYGGQFDALMETFVSLVKVVGRTGGLSTSNSHIKGWDVGDATVKALWHEKPQLDPGHLQSDAPMGAISSGSFGIKNRAAAHLVDGIGKVVRLPSRILMTTDEFMKGINYRGELKRQASRLAMEKGLKGQEYRAAVAANVADPSDRLHDLSVLQARKATFTEDLADKSLSREFQMLVARHPVMRLVFPFVRTPVNLLKFYGQRTPLLGMLSRELREDLMSGDMVRVQTAQAKMAMGSAATAFGAVLAMRDPEKDIWGITGGGPKDKGALYQAGWMPYSVWYKDEAGNTHYVQYNRMDPFAMFLGVMADAVQIGTNAKSYESYGDVISQATLAMVKNLSSKSYMQGVFNLANTFSDFDRYGGAYIQRMVGSFVVPNFFNQTNRTSGLWADKDPYFREVRTITDALMARIPGLSEDLPPRRNMWGEAVRAPVGHAPEVINPFFSSVSNNHPVVQEVMRLDLNVRHMPEKIGNVELTPEEYDQLVASLADPLIDGKTMKQTLMEIMLDPDYQALPDGEDDLYDDLGKKGRLRRVVSRYKDAARRKLITEVPRVREQYEIDLLNRATARTPGASEADFLPIQRQN